MTHATWLPDTFRTPCDATRRLYAGDEGGPYEPDVAAALHDLVRPGMTVCDVGAHAGYFTTLLASLVGPSGRVVAVEPDGESFDCLTANTAHLPQVVCVRAAVGWGQGYAGLVPLPPMANTAQREVVVLSATSRARDIRGAVRLESVPSLMLDMQNGVLPDFVKCDAQGWDADVVLGMLPHTCSCVVEWWPDGMRRVAGRDPDATLAELAAWYDVAVRGDAARGYWTAVLTPRRAIVAHTDTSRTRAEMAAELDAVSRPTTRVNEPLGCNPDDYPVV